MDNNQLNGSFRSEDIATNSNDSIPSSPEGLNTQSERLQTILFNMTLAHEIALDYNFSFGPKEYPVNSVLKVVSDNVHHAYWDLLQEQLSQKPPILDQALDLLGEIKESLCDALLPHQTKLKKEIADYLDLDLIKQQAEHDAFDFQEYARFIISLMAKICAPVRDDEVKALSQVRDLIPTLRGILEVLHKMKLDMLNFKLSSVKPDVVANSASYEKEKFQEYLEMKGGGLPFTKQWLEPYKPQEPTNRNEVNKALSIAFLELLTWEPGRPYPETLVMDHNRLIKLKDDYYKLSTIVTLVLVALSSLGSKLSADAEFKAHIIKHTTLLLDAYFVTNDGKLKAVLPNLIDQVLNDAGEKLKEMGEQGLSEEVVCLIRNQISDVNNSENKIRLLVKKRVGDFLNYVLSTPPGEFSVPPGLLLLRDELKVFARFYQHVVHHNIKVFFQYYEDILTGTYQKTPQSE